MDIFIGKWKLEENVNFDEFLIYYNYNWIKRKLALASYIDLNIQKTDDENVLKRIIDSAFMKTEEDYNLNNIRQQNELGYYKSHQIIDGEIHTNADGKGITWKEFARIKNGKLHLTRTWHENGVEKTCDQIFSKY